MISGKNLRRLAEELEEDSYRLCSHAVFMERFGWQPDRADTMRETAKRCEIAAAELHRLWGNPSEFVKEILRGLTEAQFDEVLSDLETEAAS